MLQRRGGSSTWLVVCVLSLALVLGMSASGRAEKLKEYSADQVTVKQGKEELSGSLYVMPNKIRMEHATPGEPEKMIVIFRQDMKLSWALFPKSKKYVETAFDPKEMEKQLGLPNLGIKDVTTTQKVLGTETVNGYKCEKKRMETTMQMMGQKITGQSTVWVSDKLDFPIRTETQNGVIMELRNIKPGKQDDSLFELPDGYTKSANYMEAMGGMGDEKGEAPKARGGSGGPPAQLPANLPPDVRKFLEQQMGKQPPQSPQSTE